MEWPVPQHRVNHGHGGADRYHAESYHRAPVAESLQFLEVFKSDDGAECAHCGTEGGFPVSKE